jgi:drug/metabolite transporter (DMT)-like permease
MSAFLGNPRTLRRIGLCLMIAAAIAGGIGAGLRSSLAPSAPHRSATYLLDTLGILLAIGAAVCEARVGSIMLDYGDRRARRRAIFLSIAGLGITLLACATIAGWERARPSPWLAATLTALYTGAFGAGFGGLLTLAWHYGGAYAGQRIECLGEDDW